jgi:hypothetical protein
VRRGPVNIFACDCDTCRRRADEAWDAFVAGHQEDADHLRRVFLGTEGTTPAGRVVEYLAQTRRSGEVAFDDGA